MSEKPEQPKKSKRSKARKLTINPKKRWQDIVKTVDKTEVPVDILQRIIVKLIDGTDINIDITQLLENGSNPDDIEELLNAKFEDLDEFIENVDFFIDIDKVVNAVQPETDKVLKDL